MVFIIAMGLTLSIQYKLSIALNVYRYFIFNRSFFVYFG